MALGADPWDPCFYRKAAAQSNHTAGLVQVGRIAVLFPLPLHGAVENCAAFSPTPRASGSGRGCWMRPPLYQSGCADALRCAVRDRSTVLPLLHQRFSFFFGPPSGPFLFLLRLREKEMGGHSDLIAKQNKFCKMLRCAQSSIPRILRGRIQERGPRPPSWPVGMGFPKGKANRNAFPLACLFPLSARAERGGRFGLHKPGKKRVCIVLQKKKKWGAQTVP